MPVSRYWIWGLFAVLGMAAITALLIWKEPALPADHYKSAMRAVETGNQMALRRELDWFRRTSGTEGYRSLLAGVLLLRDGNPTAALDELQHAVHDPATRVDAWTFAAEAYYKLGHLAEAGEVARSALADDPRSHRARRWLASAYYDLGAISPVTEELRILSREVPEDGRPDRLLALIAKDNEQYREAVDHYRESLRRDARAMDRFQMLIELAECQLKLQDHEGCLNSLADVPMSAARLALQAEAQEGLGRHTEARASVEQALELDPHHVPSLIFQATLLLTTGDPAMAARVLERALELQPHSATARFKLSQAYRQLGEPERAAEQSRLMEESRKLEREFVDRHHEAASDVTNAELRFRLGQLARQLGKPELARMWFRAAVSLDPNHASARQALNE
jgi:tetratricopeptide (TPR) repeat protein